MKKLVLVLALTLVACGGTGEKPTPRAPEEETANLPGDVWEYVIVNTPQGPVPCLIYDDISEGEAVSCDWSKGD